MSTIGLRRLAFGMVVAMTLGCGKGANEPKTPDLIPVIGQVLLDGAPVAGISVSFLPKDSTVGQGSYAVTDASGNFQCAYPNGKPGCPPGTYKVIFSRMAMPDGSPIPEGKTAADVGARDILPARYRSLDTLENVVTVQPAGKNEYKFELVSQ
jgi:hypothetical protein